MSGCQHTSAAGADMLADLLVPPKTQGQWSIWSFAHRDQHNIVRIAIQARTGINLNQYPLDPIPFDDIAKWLDWNQQAHDDANGVLGTQGTNLQQTDFNDPNQFEAWIYLHRREHETWANVLKVS